MNSDLLTILLAIVGTGGLGTVFINVIANRKLNKAKETMTLAEGYEKRLAILTSRICALEATQEELRGLLIDREAMIEILQKENEELKKELDIFREASKAKDERILILEARVTDLTERLNKITGKRR